MELLIEICFLIQVAREATGMAFDSKGNLYITLFSSNAVSLLDNSGNVLGTFGSGYDSDPESILFDRRGNVYIGQADGSADLLKFDSKGNLLKAFDVATGPRGSDWIDFASDQLYNVLYF